jgi:hypothetical protein
VETIGLLQGLSPSGPGLTHFPMPDVISVKPTTLTVYSRPIIIACQTEPCPKSGHRFARFTFSQLCETVSFLPLPLRSSQRGFRKKAHFPSFPYPLSSHFQALGAADYLSIASTYSHIFLSDRTSRSSFHPKPLSPPDPFPPPTLIPYALPQFPRSKHP